jgi:hypothetical protein
MEALRFSKAQATFRLFWQSVPLINDNDEIIPMHRALYPGLNGYMWKVVPRIEAAPLVRQFVLEAVNTSSIFDRYTESLGGTTG